jgi:antitoxin (DNA-binding transcriptional repressor) of toxin-antitoxin stability system
MVRTISLQNAAGQLADLVRHLAPGDEILLTDGVHQLARIVPEPRPSGKRLPG